MFAPAISKAAGAIAGASPTRPMRSVKVNASSRSPRDASVTVKCAANVSARFAFLGARLPITALRAGQTRRLRRRDVVVRAEGGGEYGERFADVDRVLVSYFTFRALKETLTQIQETDVSPDKGEYKWLYEFASANNPNDSQRFVKALFAARPAYGSRILAQRLALFAEWEKSFMPGSVGKTIEEQNLEHLRNQLFATVNLNEESLFTEDAAECVPEKEVASNAVSQRKNKRLAKKKTKKDAEKEGPAIA